MNANNRSYIWFKNPLSLKMQITWKQVSSLIHPIYEMFLCQNITWNHSKGPLQAALCIALPWVLGVQIRNYTHRNKFPLNWISISSLHFSPEPQDSIIFNYPLASPLRCLLGIPNIMFKFSSWYCLQAHPTSMPHIWCVSNTYLQTTVFSRK